MTDRASLATGIWLTWLLPCCGACAAILGAVVALGWYAHWPLIIHAGFEHLPTMKFNVAVCFVLTGTGAALMVLNQRIAATLIGAATAIALATLYEYSTGVTLGIDQLLISDYATPSNAFPGRMSPLTAICFVFLCIGLIASSIGDIRPWRFGIAIILAFLINAIAVVALCGYLGGIEAAYGWSVYSRMATHTACGLLLLGLSLLTWTLQMSRRKRVDLAHWLPLTGSITLMTVVALLAVVSLRELKSSYNSRKDAYDTLVGTQVLLGALTDTQRGMQGYVLTGRSEALDVYHQGITAMPQAVAELAILTRNNAALQSRIGHLSADFHRVMSYSKQLIALRDSQGLQAAAELESSGEGRNVANRARSDMQTLTDEVHRLLLENDAQTEKNFRSTTNLLITASFLAALLLMLAHLMTRREMNNRKRVEAKFFETYTLQKAILNSANYGIVSTSVDGTVTTFNATVERWLGYAASEIVGKATPSLWHDFSEIVMRAAALTQELGYTVDPSFECFTAKARTGITDENEWTLIRKNGSRFPAWLSCSALTDALGNITGYLGVISDMTERKQQESELRLSEERFRRAFDDAPIGIALVSTEGRWLKANHVLCKMLGYSEMELLALDFQSITHPEDLDGDLALVQEVLTSQRSSYQIEKRYFHKHGQIVDVMLSVSLVRNRNQEPLYFVSQIEDISERRKIARLKSEFISTVNHELRTPLTAIRGALGLLDGGISGTLSEKASSLVRIAYQNCDRLGLIINDILDIEKIEAGKVLLKSVRVPAADFLKQAVSINQSYADKFNVILILDTVAAELEVIADPDRLMQVVSNLLSNAAKFSINGTPVQVRAFSIGRYIRFEVEDQGVGIPEKFRDRIFEKFAQAEASQARRFSGTGLGLAISKSLVEQMKGEIGFKNRIGGGTIFFVDLPCAGGT